MLGIDKKSNGEPEIHYTRIFRKYNRWANDGSLEKIFEGSVLQLAKNKMLDWSVLHGDGSTRGAKRRRR